MPLIHFVLLGFLPVRRMRRSLAPEFAAGCGQLMVTRRERLRRGRRARRIRGPPFHDGIQLPRAFRRAGLRTDLFDATEIASCRMYRGAREVVKGLAKNAHEGMAAPGAIWLWSVLLLGGHVLPAVLAIAGAVLAPSSAWFAASLAALILGLAIRAVLALRFRQSVFGALLHPAGVAALVGIQWLAWWRRRSGRPSVWKGRVQVDG